MIRDFRFEKIIQKLTLLMLELYTVREIGAKTPKSGNFIQNKIFIVIAQTFFAEN